MDSTALQRCDYASKMMQTFTTVIVTAPTEQTRSVYDQQLRDLQKSLPCLAGCKNLFCVADPAGERVGSGGGTLNALSLLEMCLGRDSLKDERILMIHSGGDSRRAPIHTVIGKAWSSINSTLHSASISCPMGMLISELSVFCSTAPFGFLVVASSDVLLDICQLNSPVVFNDNSVAIITVPEEPETAKNHGVVVIGSDIPTSASILSVNAIKYLQKPCLQAMASEGAICKEPTDIFSSYAWIDTGVVLFCGKALEALIALLDISIFKDMLTASGSVESNGTLAAKPRLRIELYSEILLACAVLAVDMKSIEDYLRAIKAPTNKTPDEFNTYDIAVRDIYSVFQDIPLFSISVKNGIFAHLGTTEELKSLVLSAYSKLSVSTGSVESVLTKKFNRLANKYKLQPSVKSRGHFAGDVSIGSYKDDGGVSYRGSLIEYSILSGSYSIGSNSVVSHIRQDFGRHLRIRNGFIIQQVPLLEIPLNGLMQTDSDSPMSPTSGYILMLLALQDDVKVDHEDPLATICGHRWDTFFQCSKTTVNDIWPPHCTPGNRSLWTAELFPILLSYTTKKTTKYSFLYKNGQPARNSDIDVIKDGALWMSNDLEGTGISEQLRESVAHWLNAKRLSLSDLLKYGNAFSMRNWRFEIQMLMNIINNDPVKGSGRVGSIAMDEIQRMNFIDRHLRIQQADVGLYLSRIQLHVQEVAPKSIIDVSKGLASYSDIDRLNLIGNLTVCVWCWRLLFPVSMPPKTACLFFEVCHYELCAFLGFEELIGGCKDADIMNLSHLIIYSIIDHMNRIPAVECSDVLSYFLSCLGGASNSLLDIMINGFSMLLDVIDLSNLSRIFFLISIIAKQSSVGSINVEDALFDELHSEIISQKRLLSVQEVDRCLRDRARLVLVSISDQLSPPINAVKVVIKRHMRSISVEEVAQRFVSAQINWSLNVHLESSLSSQSLSIDSLFLIDRVVIASAPARIDIMGGWSDTPPICFETGGAVFNVSVGIDNRRPLVCAVRFILEPFLVLRSIQFDSAANDLSTGEIVRIPVFDCEPVVLEAGPYSSCALLKACVILFNLKQKVRQILCNLGSVWKGIEIASCSLLPTGSGMGGSSILAAAIIQGISVRMGHRLPLDTLVYMVSQAEQILTTGGGWQDQIGAIYGGFKLGYCNAGLPLQFSVKTFCTKEAMLGAAKTVLSRAFSSRVFLVYTGQQRLAKTALMDALTRNAATPFHNDIVSSHINLENSKKSSQSSIDPTTVSQLIEHAFDISLAFQEYEKTCSSIGMEMSKHQEEFFVEAANALMNKMASALSKYWSLKRQMAAGSSEPNFLRKIRHRLEPLCSGWSICGAGGGGFGVAVLQPGVGLERLQGAIAEINENQSSKRTAARQEYRDMCTIHSAQLDFDGLILDCQCQEEFDSSHDFRNRILQK